MRALPALILAAWAAALALLIELQPRRPAIVPGTLYSTWKGQR